MNDKELLAAAEDYIASQLGVHVTNPHPLAQDMTLGDLAIALGRKVRPYDNDPRTLRAAGMATSDFSRGLATGAQACIAVRFAQQAQHRRFCWSLELRDFRPATVPAVDAEVHLLPVGPNDEIQRGYVRTAAGSASCVLVRYGRTVQFSRHLIINSEWDLIAMQLATVGPNAGRTEAGLVAAALEANAALDDGGPVFDAAYGNTVAGALDATTLGTAMAALRNQELAGGGRADLALEHLAVAPDVELIALKLLHDCGIDERVTVTSMTGLPAGRWYALADPNMAPTVAVLSLKGDKKATPVRVEQAKPPQNFDGAAVKISAELGATMVGRVGIVRGQA